ncbi:MAG: hypothetical protein GY946_13055, partial [bacterium]|nr:hypothetical protein [bacterium]
MTAGLIIGADERGVVHGVYALLRKLGYGYSLGGDLEPVPRTGGFTVGDWDLSDRPLVPRRFVFNWHNFLSGCSSWNSEHWRQWIMQSQKMGFNGIMLHAYGNNPMTGFSFQGTDKPVGNLSSTRIGRDWSTMHVNDVRRLIGGEAFSGPVLGSEAAVAGTNRERTAAAQALMGNAFRYAGERRMDVILAVDMDTDSANPQALIMKLPEHARFPTSQGGAFWLPRPDVPEGHDYYKAQLAHLLEVYPQLDSFVLWFRQRGTPMLSLKVDDLPEDWRKEFEAVVAKEPEVEKYWNCVGIFVLSKVAAAHRKALRELGREDVTLGLGSWGFGLQAAADRFFPKDVELYPLDFEIQWKESRLESPGGPEGVAKVAGHRPVYPIHWANHDDCTYVGPPYPPFENFHDLLVQSKCDTSGFGILHWTTRPLDLFFVGLSDAVYESSKNQSVQTTCRRMARTMLGEIHEQVFGEYLEQWLSDLPMIGRDTSDFFIDRELKNYDEAIRSHRARMKILDQIEQSALTPVQHKRIAYFRGLESFVMGIYENEALYRHALKLQKAGDLPGAGTAYSEAAASHADSIDVASGAAFTALLQGDAAAADGYLAGLEGT